MQKTRHFDQKMNSRGINSAMTEFTLKFGDVKKDKVFLNRQMVTKEVTQLKIKQTKLQNLLKKFKFFKVAYLIKKFLNKVKRDLVIAKKILDKGGLVVVTEGGKLITTYDFESNNRLGKY